MTIDAVRDRTKTVTRRHVDTWKTLAAGDRLTLIEKGMGLPKGTKQTVICDVVIVSVRVEKLELVTPAEVHLEGLGDMTPADFCEWWASGHGYGTFARSFDLYQTECRRIEWRYISPVVHRVRGAPTGGAAPHR